MVLGGTIRAGDVFVPADDPGLWLSASKGQRTSPVGFMVPKGSLLAGEESERSHGRLGGGSSALETSTWTRNTFRVARVLSSTGSDIFGAGSIVGRR